jgi:hypothetical protein
MSSAPHIPAEIEDEISFWLAKSLKSVTIGSIELHASDKPALKLEVIKNKDKNRKIHINFLEPELFNIVINPEGKAGENTGFDKLKNKLDPARMMPDKDEKVLSFSKKLARYLTDNDLTLSISRKGKEALIIGKGAKPTFSRLLTRSGDVQIKSTKETARLTDDVLTEE